MSSALQETERGVDVEKPHPPLSSPSPLSSSSSSLFYDSPPSSSSPSSSLSSSSLISRPRDNNNGSIQHSANKTRNKSHLTATGDLKSLSSPQRMSLLKPSSLSNSLPSSPKSSPQKYILENPFISPQLTSLKPQNVSENSPKVKSPLSHPLELIPTSPSILRKPSQNYLKTNETVCKKVKFQRPTSETNDVPNIKNKSHQIESIRPSNQHPLSTSSHHIYPATQTTVLTGSPTKTGETKTTNSFLQHQSFFHNHNNSTTSFPISPPNFPSKTSTLQQKSSWDESLEQLSKGLKNICGSPEAFSVKSFKRASSLSADYRRKTISPSLSPHRTTINTSTLPKDCRKSGLSPQRNFNPLHSCSGEDTSLKRVLSHSPTILFACKDEELYGFVPVPDVNNHDNTTHQTLKQINILELISNTHDGQSNKEQINNINMPHCHSTVAKDNKALSNIASASNIIQTKRAHVRKQQSLFNRKTDICSHQILTSLASLKKARKLTVRHEESFQSLETELCRLLCISGDENINKKIRSSNGFYDRGGTDKMLYNESIDDILFDQIGGSNSTLYDDKEGNSKSDVRVRRNTENVEYIKDREKLGDAWKDKDDSGDEDNDEMGFIKVDYSTLCKVSLPPSGWSVEDLYVEVLKIKTIVVGVLKNLGDNGREKQEIKNKYEKEIIQEITNIDNMPSDLICTLSTDLKYLLLKGKKKEMQLHEENNHNSCPGTHDFNNDKFFVSYAECLSGVYLPILIQRSSHDIKFMSIFLKLPNELQYDSMSVKRIDECVLISANKAKCQTSPLKNPFISDFLNMNEGTSMNNETPETISNTYNVCNQRQNQQIFHDQNTQSTSFQQSKQSTQTNSMKCSNNQFENQSTLNSPCKTTTLPTSKPFCNLKYNSSINSPIQKPTNSPLKFPSNPPKPSSNQSKPSSNSPKPSSNQPPDFFASFSLPCNANLRGTMAHLTHHHILAITLPLYNDFHRRFSF